MVVRNYCGNLDIIRHKCTIHTTDKIPFLWLQNNIENISVNDRIRLITNNFCVNDVSYLVFSVKIYYLSIYLSIHYIYIYIYIANIEKYINKNNKKVPPLLKKIIKWGEKGLFVLKEHNSGLLRNFYFMSLKLIFYKINCV